MHATEMPEYTSRQRWIAVLAMLIGHFMLMIDVNIVSIANPAIQRSLRASLTATIWVTSAYMLANAVFLLVAGRLADRFGIKQVFLLGLVVFVVSSLICGFAPTIGWLIGARVL